MFPIIIFFTDIKIKLHNISLLYISYIYYYIVFKEDEKNNPTKQKLRGQESREGAAGRKQDRRGGFNIAWIAV